MEHNIFNVKGWWLFYLYKSSFSYNHDSQLARFLFYDSNPFMIQHNTQY